MADGYYNDRNINQIVRINDIKTCEYVYDIETEKGWFNGGVG